MFLSNSDNPTKIEIAQNIGESQVLRLQLAAAWQAGLGFDGGYTLLDWWWAGFVLELILFCLEKGLANEVLAGSEHGG